MPASFSITQKQMKTFMIIFLVNLTSMVGASENNSKHVRLENGQELNIKHMSPSRILPHAYYDQAVASIPGVYPNSQIIAKRRLGYLGKNPSFLYSMVSYKKSKDLPEVTISGVVVNKNRAWFFEAKVDESSFADTLVLVLETLADLPSNKSLQP